MKKIGAWYPAQDGLPSGRRSISATRRFLTSAVAVLCLERGRDDRETFCASVRCSCALYCKLGQCSHELCVHYLEADLALRVHGEKSVRAASLPAPQPAWRFAEGNPNVRLPARAAWSTVSDVFGQAQKNWAKRQEVQAEAERCQSNQSHPSQGLPQLRGGGHSKGGSSARLVPLKASGFLREGQRCFGFRG